MQEIIRSVRELQAALAALDKLINELLEQVAARDKLLTMLAPETIADVYTAASGSNVPGMRNVHTDTQVNGVSIGPVRGDVLAQILKILELTTGRVPVCSYTGTVTKA